LTNLDPIIGDYDTSCSVEEMNSVGNDDIEVVAECVDNSYSAIVKGVISLESDIIHDDDDGNNNNDDDDDDDDEGYENISDRLNGAVAIHPENGAAASSASSTNITNTNTASMSITMKETNSSTIYTSSFQHIPLSSSSSLSSSSHPMSSSMQQSMAAAILSSLDRSSLIYIDRGMREYHSIHSLYTYYSSLTTYLLFSSSSSHPIIMITIIKASTRIIMMLM